jgi:hypothetical protein
MANFLDILEECCKDGGECKCKKGEKCNSPTCKCKTKKVVKEAKDSDEAGDAKFHAKKDDALDEKCSKCGSTKGYVNGKCLGCGAKGTVKESKFDKYIVEAEAETKSLTETVDVILEKLGSLEPMDAKELGLPGNTPISSDMLVKAFRKAGSSVDSFIKKVKSVFQGITDDELDSIKLRLDIKSGSGSYVFGK